MTEKITAERFERAVGRPPEQDDLIRSNCHLAGEFGHLHCGWDRVANLPVFEAAARLTRFRN